MGSLEVLRWGRRIAVPAAKQRIALTSLLLHANQYVSADQMIHHVWYGEPPKDARAALHTHIARLRHALLDDGSNGKRLIHTRDHGYLIEVGDTALDVVHFRDLVRRAGEARATGAEAALLRGALGLWRGPALANVPSESLQREYADRLGEERLQALERWVELSLQSGRHEEVIAELRTATAMNPLRERLWMQLMIALYRRGGQAEALRAYHTIAELLRDELGVDPNDELRQLYQSILVTDPSSMPSPIAAADRPVEVRPWQLPSDIAAFTGRIDELQTLDGLLNAPGDGVTRPVKIAVVTGGAGVGKTALAVHWGHRIRWRFPDGQLYVNLRGFGPDSPIEPATALEMLLQGLGIPAQSIPARLEARSALLRTVLTNRRMLIVLDNARDAPQVRPLLPGSDCLVLITSRDRLHGLSLHGDTSHLKLGVFSAQEPNAMLVSILGPDRVRAEPEATAELSELCAHLPLALRIAAANLALDRYQSVADYVAELREGNRLAALRIHGDEHSAIHVTLELSYAALPPRDRLMFRLLALIPGVDFSAEAAAALSGSTAERTRAQLSRLATAHLIEQYAPGRYRFHDLLRIYAADRARAETTSRDREEARQRLYDWYLRSVRAAVERTHPYWARLPLPRSPTGVTAAAFGDPASAAAWLAAEHRNLVAAIHQAVSSGPRPAVWLLTDALRGPFQTARDTSDRLSCARVALAVAEEEGDDAAVAAASLVLASVHTDQERRDAISLYGRALSLADKAGWKAGMCCVRDHLAATHLRLGRLDEAAHLYKESIKLDEGDGPSASLGIKHGNLGMVYAQLGHLDSAHHHLTQALQFHDDDGVIAVNLGEVCHLQGRFDDALRHLRRALSQLQRARNHAIEPYCLVVLTGLHCEQGRYDQALAVGEHALTRSRAIEDRLAEALALNALGKVHERTGHLAEAMDHHRRAVDVAGDEHLLAKAGGLIGLADTARGRGRPDAAVSFAEEALYIARERSFRVPEGLALTALADIAMERADHVEAAQQARFALNIHRETGHRPAEARTLHTLGRAVHGAEAATYRKQAMRLFKEMGVA